MRVDSVGNRMRYLARALLLLAFLPGHLLNAQQPPGSPQTPSNTNQEGTSARLPAADAGKSKPIPSFLIIGTVFNEKALSFPGVQVRIRKTGEKRFAWETYTNSRGEFAVRVPPGFDYDVWVHVKKYKDQTKSVDSKVDVQQRLSIQLEPVT
jgi:hypothetical protein